MFNDLGAVPMTEINRNKLREAMYDLKTCMESKPVMCYLVSKRILTNDEQSEIELNTTNDCQVVKLIKLLQRKSDSAFSTFIEALMKTEQWHAVTIIMESCE